MPWCGSSGPDRCRRCGDSLELDPPLHAIAGSSLAIDIEKPVTTPGLGAAARRFFAHASPRILAAVTTAAVALRVAAGHWRWWDLGTAAIIIGLEPFTEWTIHVLVLHFRPRRVLGRQLDPLVAAKHRAHHRDPRDPVLVFVPLRVLVISLGAAAAAWLAVEPSRSVALTGLTTSYAMLFAYEWTHFLIHTPYRPKTRVYRYIWRAHRWHHYRNEHYWFGVTMHLADHLLGTFPDRDEVPLSPTARTLAQGSTV